LGELTGNIILVMTFNRFIEAVFDPDFLIKQSTTAIKLLMTIEFAKSPHATGNFIAFLPAVG
jgi:hypothetical protein